MRTLNENLLNKMAEYIVSYQKENALSPSYRNIMHKLNMSSLNLVQLYVKALEKHGYIERTNLGNIRLPPQLDPGRTTLTPLVGEIACGKFSTAIEHIEDSFLLPQGLFGSGNLMLLRATGDSMIDVGIIAGDLLVIRKQQYADPGEIVVALNGDDTTLKRIYFRGGKTILHPENKNMKDIIVDYCDIQGVLVSCIKMY